MQPVYSLDVRELLVDYGQALNATASTQRRANALHDCRAENSDILTDQIGLTVPISPWTKVRPAPLTACSKEYIAINVCLTGFEPTAAQL